MVKNRLRILNDKMAEQETRNVICPCCDSVIGGVTGFPIVKIDKFEYVELPRLIIGAVENVMPLEVVEERRFRKRIIPNPEISEDIGRRLESSKYFSFQGKVYERVTIIQEDKITPTRSVIKEDYFKRRSTLFSEEELASIFEEDGIPYKKPSERREEDLMREFGESYNPQPGVRVYRDITNDVNDFILAAQWKLRRLEENVGKQMLGRDIFNLFLNDKKRELCMSWTIKEPILGQCNLIIDVFDAPSCSPFGSMYDYLARLPAAKFTYQGFLRETQSEQ